MRGCFRSLRSDTRGVALIEFAITAPLLLLLYLGGYAALDALTCNRRVTLAARSVADLTSRYSGVSTSDLATIMGSTAQVMWPYDTSTGFGVRVSEVQVTSSSAATVVWSQGQNAIALTAGTSIVIPKNLATPGSYMILGEVSYAYNSPVSFRGFGSLALQQAIFMVPRISTSVAKT